MSVHDFDRYDDSGVNWRVVEGYGAAIVAHAAGVPVALDCPVRGSIMAGSRLSIETAQGRHRGGRRHRHAAERAHGGGNDCSSLRPCRRRPRRRRACRSGSPTSCFFRWTSRRNSRRTAASSAAPTARGTGTYHFRPFGRPHDRGLFRRPAGRRARGGGRGGVLRLRRDGARRAARQRFRGVASSRCTSIAGARTRSRAAPTPMPCRARRIAAPCSPRRWTIASSSPARPARAAITRPRTAPISPASPPPSRRSRRGAAGELRRERLEAAGGRRVELGPVDLLLDAMIGLVADRSLRSQALQRLPLNLDRAQPQLVVLGRRLRLVGIFGDGARRRILLANSRRGARCRPRRGCRAPPA